MAHDERLGVAPAAAPRTFVIDYSAPNVAKPMHVGHLRSTIIGDALARLLRVLGHQVVGDNHLGDWGNQFGILIYGYKNFRDEAAFRADPVRKLARLYVHVRRLMKADDDEEGNDPVSAACRQETAKLHTGDPENVALWQLFMPACLEELNVVYRRLGVHIDETLGESFYNPMLAEVVRSVEDSGLAQRSNGALVIRFGDNEPPSIVQKRNGAYTYTATDLATIRYRVERWHPDTMLYVVDSRQALHFKNLFDAARRWGFDRVLLEHVSFGSMLGENNKPLKTREGGVIELGALLDEAVQRAGEVYTANRQERLANGQEVPDLTAAELQHVQEVVGIGAVKYADLCQNRTSDYVFSWPKMLAMSGNTGTYMQYAYARNRSILRKADVDEAALPRIRPAFPSTPPMSVPWPCSSCGWRKSYRRRPSSISRAA